MSRKAAYLICRRRGLPLKTNISWEKQKIKTKGKTTKPGTLRDKPTLISHVYHHARTTYKNITLIIRRDSTVDRLQNAVHRS